MGEKKLDDMIEALEPKSIRYVDPMKLAQWSLETCCLMVDGVVSKKTIERAIDAGELEAFKVGAKVSVEPLKFLSWYKRNKK